jgi:hypothetical protein
MFGPLLFDVSLFFRHVWDVAGRGNILIFFQHFIGVANYILIYC